MLTINSTKQFRKDLKRYQNQQNILKDLDIIIRQLTEGKPLEKCYRDHSLTGNWVNYRECHVKSDVLLIYRIDEDLNILLLERMGSHSELFH